jgi:hypothetical protein
MAKIANFAPVETASGWMVNIPKSLSDTGQRQRRYFAKSGEAKKFAAGLKSDFLAGRRGVMTAAAAAEANGLR